ncbi:hypothetical protein [Marinomonas sp. BSi20584]|nr:hypothetical protein [Marinomonas sp. BSi20584]
MVRWFDGSMVRWFDGSMVRWFDGSMVRKNKHRVMRVYGNTGNSTDDIK